MIVWTYLWGAEALDEGNHVQRRVLGFQTLHLGVEPFALCGGKTQSVAPQTQNAIFGNIHLMYYCIIEFNIYGQL